MNPNDKQVGGDHYRKVPGEQHWDRVHRLGMNYFQASATLYIERYKDKNGKEDLEKAIHFIQKLISLEYPGGDVPADSQRSRQIEGTSFEDYEKNHARYMHDTDFLCEGGWGDGTNLYTHRGTKAKLYARSLREAAEVYAATGHLAANLTGS